MERRLPRPALTLLAPPDSAIGVNGIAFKGDTLYSIVSCSGRILKVP